MNLLPGGPPPSVFNTCHAHVVHVVDNNYLQVRDHQRQAIKDAAVFYNVHKSGQVVLPTGAGKSGVAVLLPYYMNHSRVLVVAPSPDLAEQFAAQFSGPVLTTTSPIPARRDDAFFFKANLDVANGSPSLQGTPANRRIILPTHALALNADAAKRLFDRDLLVINREKFQGPRTRLQVEQFRTDYDLLIVDEAHHYPAATWKKIVDHFAHVPTKVLFLTATPNEDRNTPPVAKIYELNFLDAVRDHAIRDIIWNEVSGPPGQALEKLVEHLKTVVGTLDGEGHFYQAMIAFPTVGTTSEANDVVNLYNAGVARPRERAEACTQESAAGVANRFKKNEFRTVVVVHKLMEGFDHPDVAFVVVARNMKMRPFNQFVGRATRIDDGRVQFAQVISHQVFNQESNFHAMRHGTWAIAQDDEEEDDE
ncbi:hypothetical protein BASA81_016575 [Batrachochytrium salamandrivorans]|nr:hypothetical protein BASA81_016575 [Batrachochytrium salamandrivorans]